jgi:hypothetical protein
MPDNVNTVPQIIGRIHRIGQLFVQFVWIYCVLGTYDRWLFANATAGMLDQIVGEDKMQDTDEFTQEHRARMVTQPDDMTADDAHAILTDLNIEGLLAQAEEYIRQQLRTPLRRSSHGWAAVKICASMVHQVAMGSCEASYDGFPAINVHAFSRRRQIHVQRSI